MSDPLAYAFDIGGGVIQIDSEAELRYFQSADGIEVQFCDCL